MMPPLLLRASRAVLLCLPMVLLCAVANGSAPVPVRPGRPHRVEGPSRVLGAHGRAEARPYGRRVGQTSAPQTDHGTPKPSAKPGAKKPDTKSTEKPAAKPAPHAKKRRRRPQPQDDDSADPPMMVRVNGRRRVPAVLLPAPLKGSRDILLHQNLMADEAGLERIQDDTELALLRSSGDLVDMVNTRALQLNPDLPEDRRCARPWTVRFANDLARGYYARFGEPLVVTSAARSAEFQERLQLSNGNAAGIDGEVASPHLTGQAIDIGKGRMTRAELAWMRSRLRPLIDAGKIDVEEEFHQACFHISVYRSYMPKAVPKQAVARLRRAPAPAAMVETLP